MKIIGFKHKVRVLSLNDDNNYLGIIEGKISNLPYYVVLFSKLNRENNHRQALFEGKYGLPVRHLPLEWGVWTGSKAEFLIAEGDLEIVNSF